MNKKRWLALLMVFVMLIGVFPMTAFAEEHVHSDGCYAGAGDLLCSLEESDGHTHGESCYCTGGEYVCGLEGTGEHTHTDECICQSGELICLLEKSEGHAHGENCDAKGEELICGFEGAALFDATALTDDLGYEDIITILENDSNIDFDPETQALLIIDIDTEISEHLQNFGLNNTQLKNATEFSFLYKVYFEGTPYKGTCYAIDDDGNISVNQSTKIGEDIWGTPITDTARNVIIADKNTEYSVIPYCREIFWGNCDVEPYGTLRYVPMPLGQSEIDAKTGTVSDSEAEITYSYLWDVYNWFEVETWYLDTDSKYCDLAGDFDFDSSVDYLIELRDADGNISTFDTVYWDYGYDDNDYFFCEDGVIHQNIEPYWEGPYGEGSFMFPVGYDFRIRVLQNGTELGTLMLVQHDTLKSLDSGYGSFEYDADGFCLCADDYMTEDYIIGHYFIQPSSTIRVEKIVQGANSDQSYDFSITRTVAEVSKNIHSDTSWTLFPDITIPMINTNYTLYNSETDEKIGTGRTDMQGKFTMQGGQYAIFDVWELPADIETYTDWGYSYLDILDDFNEQGEDLPTCSVYTITEELPKNENCTTTVTHTKKDGTKSIVDGKVIKGVLGGDTILFQNVYDNNPNDNKTGSLKVSKTVSGNAASTTKAFTFTVTLDDTSISGTYGDMVFENGVAVFTLKDGESKTALDLPAGTNYMVEESDNTGYTVTVNDSSQATVTGTIVADTTAKAAFNNHKSGDHENIPVVNPATVTIRAQKTLDGNAAVGSNYSFVLMDESGNIIQTVQNHNGDITFAPLSFEQIGTYTYTLSEVVGSDREIIYDTTVYKIVVEVTKSGDYKAVVSYKKDGDVYNETPIFANRTISSDNTDETMEVSVSKVWDDNDHVNRPSSISVQLYKEGVVYGEPIILNAENNWSHTWSQLESTAVWTVDEVSIPDGYSKTVTHSGNYWTITNTWNVLPDTPDKPDVPDKPDKPVDRVSQTGDNSSKIELWTLLACVSMVAMLALVLFKKRFSIRK